MVQSRYEESGLAELPSLIGSGPAGSQSPVSTLGVDTGTVLVKLLISDLDGDTEGCTSRLLMTLNWEEQLIHYMGMLPFTQTSTGPRNGLTRTLLISTIRNTNS